MTRASQFGYNVDVLAPPEFNDAMPNGFQAIIAGDKTPRSWPPSCKPPGRKAWQRHRGDAAAD